MNQSCFLCNKEIKNYKHDSTKDVVCASCTMGLCKNPRNKNDSLTLKDIAFFMQEERKKK